MAIYLCVCLWVEHLLVRIRTCILLWKSATVLCPHSPRTEPGPPQLEVSCFRVSEQKANEHLAYIHSYIHTYMQAYIHTYIHTRIHTYIHTHIHTYTHTRIHAYTHTRIHAYTHACMHAYIHTYIHTHIHAHTHTHIAWVCECACLSVSNMSFKCMNREP
jgi:hypothetical protein